MTVLGPQLSIDGGWTVWIKLWRLHGPDRANTLPAVEGWPAIAGSKVWDLR
jgi:hypothetical protein